MTASETTVQPTAERLRGHTTVPAAVFAKIAAQAAWEVPEVGAASGGVLGVGSRRDFERRPHADVELLGSTAVVRLDLGLRYPAPVAATCAEVRRRVDATLRRDTGVTRTQVDIKVSWLHPDDGPEIRRLR